MGTKWLNETREQSGCKCQAGLAARAGEVEGVEGSESAMICFREGRVDVVRLVGNPPLTTGLSVILTCPVIRPQTILVVGIIEVPGIWEDHSPS